MRGLLILVLLLVLAFLAVGTWPLCPVFGDGMAMANAVSLALEGAALDNPLMPHYVQHMGTASLLYAIANGLGVDSVQAYLVVCAMAALVALFATASLLRTLNGYAWPLSLGVPLLFQESFTAAYYGNTTVVAAAPAFAALLIAAHGRTLKSDVVAAALLALATWMRLDAVLVLPAALLIAALSNRPALPGRITAAGVVFTGLLCVLLMAGGFEIAALRDAIGFKNTLFDAARDLRNTGRSLMAFFTLLCVFLMACGLARMLRDRDWRNLGIVALGLAPTLALYGPAMDTPRYLYYTLPFVSLLAAHGFRMLTRLPVPWRMAGLGIALVLFVGQYALGVRQVPGGAVVDGAERRTHIRLGPGETAIGAGNNAGRLASGIAFAPLWHSRQKRLAGSDQASLATALEAAESDTIVVLGWTDLQLAILVVLSKGWTLAAFEESGDQRLSRYEFSGPRGTLVVHYFMARAGLPDPQWVGSLLDDLEPGAILQAHPDVLRRTRVDPGPNWERLGRRLRVKRGI